MTYQIKTAPGERWVPTTEVTKYVRAALKERFNGVKFSVRKDGGSIRVTWPMGEVAKTPAAQKTLNRPVDNVRRDESMLVELLVGDLHGEGFDGMIDLRYSRKHYLLADGTIYYAGSEGTASSGGSVSGGVAPMPEGAREIRLGNDFIFCQAEW